MKLICHTPKEMKGLYKRSYTALLNHFGNIAPIRGVESAGYEIRTSGFRASSSPHLLTGGLPDYTSVLFSFLYNFYLGFI